MDITPAGFLWILVALTTAAWAINLVLRIQRTTRMSHWARQSHLFYCPVDLLGLAPRVARLLPFAGAANVRVTDLMYRSADGIQYSLFTIEFTRGVMSHRDRVVHVAALNEPISRHKIDQPPKLILAPDDLPVLTRYRQLLASVPPETP